jgi:hypothetical protein
MVKYN